VSNSRANTGPTGDLAQLAAVARRALAADAVVISTRATNGRTLWPGAVGLDKEDLPSVGLALASMELELDENLVLKAPSLSTLSSEGAQVLLRHGFGSALGAAVSIDGEDVGEIHALRRAEGPFDDESLIRIFARHAAVTVGHHRLRRHTKTLAEDREALDQLVRSARNFDELIRALNQHVAPLFGAELIGIMVWDENRQVLQMVPGSFSASDELSASYQISSLDAHSNAARVFSTGRPYMSDDAPGDPGILHDYVEAFGIKNTLSLPLLVGGATIGVLHIANKPTDFTAEDLHRAEMLAPQIALVVELARPVFRLRREHLMESILSRLAVSIAAGENVHDFLRPALLELCVAAEASLIALVFDGSPVIVSRVGARHHALEGMVLSQARRRAKLGASGARPQQPGDPGWAALHVPVRFGSQRVGTVGALRARGEPFAVDERRALERLASLAALAYTSERYQRQRAELARLEERDRIADDLHDDVAQILFGAQLALDTALEGDALPPEAVAQVLRARNLLTKGDEAIRTVIHELSSPQTGNLAERLSSLIETVERAYGLPIRLEVSERAMAIATQVSEPIAQSMLKVAREALVNSAKHAGPCRVVVKLEVDLRDWLELAVVDDGLVPSATDGHQSHGLASLRKAVERQGGTLQARAGSTGGFKVKAVIPT
jgi:signal transduction histidine kinase